MFPFELKLVVGLNNPPVLGNRRPTDWTFIMVVDVNTVVALYTFLGPWLARLVSPPARRDHNSIRTAPQQPQSSHQPPLSVLHAHGTFALSHGQLQLNPGEPCAS